MWNQRQRIHDGHYPSGKCTSFCRNPWNSRGSDRKKYICQKDNVLLSVGTPGVPGGAIASFAALATMAGLPAGVMGVYISINTLCDMGATCVNVIGDLACCVALKGRLKIDETK